MAKLVKKMILQIKAHFFNPENLILIIGFLATSKLACDRNDIYEGSAMWVLPHFVRKALDYALNSRMSVEDDLSPLPLS